MLATALLLAACAGGNAAHKSLAASPVSIGDSATGQAEPSATTTMSTPGRATSPAASSHNKAPAVRQSTRSVQPGNSPGTPATGTPNNAAPSQQAGGAATGGTADAAATATQPFLPTAVNTGATPTTEVTLSDLTTPQGSTPLTMIVSPSGPSQISLNEFAASAGGYPLNGVRACLSYAGDACTPVATPNPAFWTITAAELARHSRYSLTVQPPASSNTLGLRLGWTGAHTLSVSGLRAAGGCSVTTGYHDGCGFVLHTIATATGTVTISCAESGLHLSVKDKTTGTKIFSGALRGSASFAAPGGDEWAAHFYPESGAPVLDVALSVLWP